MVDNQHGAPLPAPISRQKDLFPVGKMVSLENSPPLFQKLFLILDLVLFDTAVGIGPV